MTKNVIRAYKFYPQKWALEAIQRKRLKISEFDKLNDPFEFLGVNLQNKDHRRAVQKMKSELGKNRGLISFSEGWDNPVLWSHYADSHQGIALGFDIPYKYDAPNDYITKISYKSEMEEFPKIGEVDEEFAKKLLKTKFDQWEYENELRLWTTLDEPDPVTELFFKVFDEKLVLKEIVLGAKYCSRKAKVWEDQLKEEGVEIITSRLEFGKFRIRKQDNKSLWKTL